LVIRRASKGYPLEGRDTGIIEASTFSQAMTAHSYVTLFRFATAHPRHPGSHFLPSGSYCMFSKVVLPIRCDIVTVSCNRHVIATSRLLAYSTFSRWYYNPFASSRLHPTSGNFDDDQRHTSSLTTRHDTNPFLVASLVSLSASLKAATVRRKSRPQIARY
jgi:hypothetical protein